MSKTKIILAAVVLLVLVGGGAYIVSNDSKTTEEAPVTSASKESLNPNASSTILTPTDTTKPATKPTVSGSVGTPVIKTTGSGSVSVTTTKSFSSSDVAQHNSSQSCWSIVNGKVYDLTSWIGKHPGGASAIKSMCGIDASAAFNDQHGGERRPANELAGFYIGDLK